MGQIPAIAMFVLPECVPSLSPAMREAMLQVHRFTFENHSYVGCTTEKADHSQGHPWCHLECIGESEKWMEKCENADAEMWFFLKTYQLL